MSAVYSSPHTKYGACELRREHGNGETPRAPYFQASVDFVYSKNIDALESRKKEANRLGSGRQEGAVALCTMY